MVSAAKKKKYAPGGGGDADDGSALDAMPRPENAFPNRSRKPTVVPLSAGGRPTGTASDGAAPLPDAVVVEEGAPAAEAEPEAADAVSAASAPSAAEPSAGGGGAPAGATPSDKAPSEKAPSEKAPSEKAPSEKAPSAGGAVPPGPGPGPGQNLKAQGIDTEALEKKNPRDLKREEMAVLLMKRTGEVDFLKNQIKMSERTSLQHQKTALETEHNLKRARRKIKALESELANLAYLRADKQILLEKVERAAGRYLEKEVSKSVQLEMEMQQMLTSARQMRSLAKQSASKTTHPHLTFHKSHDLDDALAKATEVLLLHFPGSALPAGGPEAGEGKGGRKNGTNLPPVGKGAPSGGGEPAPEQSMGRLALLKGRASSFIVRLVQMLREIMADVTEQDITDYAQHCLFDFARSSGATDSRLFFSRFSRAKRSKMPHMPPVAVCMLAGLVQLCSFGLSEIELARDAAIANVHPDSFLLVFTHRLRSQMDVTLPEMVGGTPFFLDCVAAGYMAGWAEGFFGVRMRAIEFLHQSKNEQSVRFAVGAEEPTKAFQETLASKSSASLRMVYNDGSFFLSLGDEARKRPMQTTQMTKVGDYDADFEDEDDEDPALIGDEYDIGNNTPRTARRAHHDLGVVKRKKKKKMSSALGDDDDDAPGGLFPLL